MGGGEIGLDQTLSRDPDVVEARCADSVEAHIQGQLGSGRAMFLSKHRAMYQTMHVQLKKIRW